MTGWPSGMLVDAYEQCPNMLQGTVDGCPVFEKSRDQAKADACFAKGEVASEVFPLQRPQKLGLILQAIGLDVPLAQLPGSNPVYNSSRDSPDYPKRSFANYVESAKIVPVDAAGHGTCNRQCHDYTV